MARKLNDRTLVEIFCHVTPNGLNLVLDGESLDHPDDDNAVVVLNDGDPLPSVELRIHDGASGDYDVYTWEDGNLWTLHTQGYRHRSCQTIAVDLPIALISSGGTPPAAPPAPGSGSTTLTVKVRKKGTLPIP